MTWEEFKEALAEIFLLESVRRARAREFEKLKWMLSMIMVEYDVCFT